MCIRDRFNAGIRPAVNAGISVSRVGGAAQTKIIECGTGAFGAQAPLYSGVIVDAYKASDAQVKVSEMRAAVEKHNDDGSIDVLVAVRIKISNSAQKDKEVGYRLRAQMAPVDGTYKVAKLDQVTS